MKDLIKESEIVIFGAGDIGSDLYQRIMRFRHNPVACFCDNNPAKQGKIIDGRKVLSLTDAVSQFPNALYVITVSNNTAAVSEQLMQAGVQSKQIMTFGIHDYINEEDKKRQLEKAEQYKEWCLKHNTRIRELKGLYKGKRCFVIGNGGSLTVEDLEKLNGEYTFASNRLYKMFAKLSWRPVFYCVYDMQRIELLKKDLPYILNNCDYMFLSSLTKDGLDKEIVTNTKTYFVHVENQKFYPDLPKFSETVDEYVYDGQTVLYVATQIAVYLGFSEIYYLGADNSYSIEINLDGSIKCDTSVKDYPAEIGGIEMETSNIPQTGLAAMSYEAVKKYADSHKIRVYNATRGGKLEVFQRVDFDSLF